MRPVGGERNALHIARLADGDDHLLALDQVFDVGLELQLLDFGAARRAEAFLHLDEFVAQDAEQLRAVGQRFQEVGDLVGDVLQLRADLVALQPGQAVQTQIQDGAGLLVGNAVGALRADAPARLVDQFDQRADVVDRPFADRDLLARPHRIGGAADQLDHRVEVGDGDGQAHQGVRPLARLAQQEFGAAGDDLLAELDEGLDNLPEIHQFRATAAQRQHVDAEGRLKLGVAEQLGQDDFRHRVALQLDHHADAVAVGFVAQVGNALDDLVVDHLADAFHQLGLVDLERNLGGDDGEAVLADLFNVGLGAQDDRAAPEAQTRPAARAAQISPPVGKSGPGTISSNSSSVTSLLSM